jgi:hypothetical protein
MFSEKLMLVYSAVVGLRGKHVVILNSAWIRAGGDKFKRRADKKLSTFV